MSPVGPLGRRIKRSRRGGVELRIPETEREFLRDLAPQMRAVFEDPSDPVHGRLYPKAYPDHDDRETEYRLLAHVELVDSHLAALAELESSAGADRLSEEQADAWLRAINEVRLVLGTRLDVTEEGDERPRSATDPRLPAFAAYDYLSMLQSELIDALIP